MSLNYKVSGVWKKTEPYVNVNGVWKLCDDVFANVSGTWKSILYEPGNTNVSPPFTYTFIVPPGVYSLNFGLVGGGGGYGGNDGTVHGGYWGLNGDTLAGKIAVQPKQVLHLIPGWAGKVGGAGKNAAGGPGGYSAAFQQWAGGDGGRSGGVGVSGAGGGGGSAAVIILENSTVPLVVAAGGGGGAGAGKDSGGHGREPVEWNTNYSDSIGSPVGYGPGWNLAQGTIGDAGEDKIAYDWNKDIYKAIDGGGGGGGGGGYPRGGAGGSLVGDDNGAWSGFNGQSYFNKTLVTNVTTTLGVFNTTNRTNGNDGSVSIWW